MISPKKLLKVDLLVHIFFFFLKAKQQAHLGSSENLGVVELVCM